MHFTKIKMAGPRVELHWTTPKGAGEVKHELTSFEHAAPEFVAAIAAFVPHALDILELPTAYAEGFMVTGLSINYEDSGRRGLVITSLRKLAAANAPLVLNTPHLREEQDGDPAGKYLPEKLLDLLNDAEEHATAFVNGTRAHGDLFAKPAPGAEKTRTGQLDALDDTTISINGGPSVPLSVAKAAMDVISGRDRAAGRDE